MTAVEICNLALAHLRSGTTISNIDDQTDDLARVCRQFYTISRQEILRCFAWPFAKRFQPLVLIDRVQDGSREWEYQYVYPTNSLRLIKISSTLRDDTRGSRVRYQIETDGSRQVIFTQMKDAVVYFIEDLEDTTQFPPDVFMALSYLIAARIAPIVTDGDTEGLGSLAMENYEMLIDKSKVNALNEEQHEEIEATEYIDFRE